MYYSRAPQWPSGGTGEFSNPLYMGKRLVSQLVFQHCRSELSTSAMHPYRTIEQIVGVTTGGSADEVYMSADATLNFRRSIYFDCFYNPSSNCIPCMQARTAACDQLMGNLRAP